MTQYVVLAVELPIAAKQQLKASLDDPELKQELGKLGPDATVELREPDETKVGGPTGLTFEPVTGAAVGWFVLKFAGLAAKGLAAKFITDFVWRKLQAKEETARQSVRIRFRDGDVFELVVGDAKSAEHLEQKLDDRVEK